MTGPGFDKGEWLDFHSKRTGVPAELLERAFREELKGSRHVDQPLEIPDRMDVTYKYSYGGQSRFFRELRDHGRLLGAKCPECGFVYCPPRTHCSRCYIPTQWMGLSGEGVVHTCTTVYVGTSAHVGQTPFVCGYVKLDGADTFLWQFIEVNDPSRARPGLRVRSHFREHRHGLMSDFVFKPVESGLGDVHGGSPETA